MKTVRIKALLFDADGTLYDSSLIHFEAYRQVCKKYYGFDYTRELFQRDCLQRYLKPSETLEEHGITCPKEEFSEFKRPIYVSLANELLNSTSGLLTLLQKATDNNIPCAIVSGSSRNSLEDSLNILNLGHFFKLMLSYEDAPKNQKPDPYGYNLAKTKLGIPAHECLVFEDTESGIRAAKNASMLCVGILNKTNSRKTLREADLIVENYEELETRFENEQLFIKL